MGEIDVDLAAALQEHQESLLDTAEVIFELAEYLEVDLTETPVPDMLRMALERLQKTEI